MMFGYGAGWSVLMVVGMLVFFGFLVWGTYALFGATSRGGYGPGPGSSSSTAREILDGRLARGEINTDEYRRLVDAMSAGARDSHDVRS